MNNRIQVYLNEHRDEIVNTLKELVKIPSIRGEAEENAPFGKACADVLEFTKSLYAKNGFNTELSQDGGYLLSYFGDGEKTLGIFSHADVVPVVDDWIYANPFEPIEKDGFLIGRGVLDDKSAIVISLYCAKMLKELNIPFNSRLVMFTGANEESGMQDIQNYANSHIPPDFSLVADTAFPLYRGQKGNCMFNATLNEPLIVINEFSGGKPGTNVGHATLKMDYSEDTYRLLKKNESDNIKISKENDEIIITAFGIAKHAALPEGSVNAAGLITDWLLKFDLFDNKTTKQIAFLNSILNDYYGNGLNIANDDKEFGKLTCVNYQIDIKNGYPTLCFNIRYGKSVDVDVLEETLKEEFEKRNWTIDVTRKTKAYSVEEGNPYVQKCLNTFKGYTGVADAKPHINAGGTYAKFLPCAVETGTTLGEPVPFELPQGHGMVHQPDECISIDGMLKAIELTMLMILECDKE